MLIVAGSIYLNPPPATAAANPAIAAPGPQSSVIDDSLPVAAEPTSFSTGAVLGICLLLAWRFRRGRAD
jgi:hypothetical protein